MKSFYNSKTKNPNKTRFLLFATVLITSFFTSCTMDEITSEPNNKSLEESYLQRKDSIINATNGSDIVPPPKLPPPPPPENP